MTTLVEERKTEASADRAPQGEPVTLEVEGMTCAGCASSVQRSLAAVPGVREANVNLPLNRATVTVDPAAAPSREELVRAVEKAGYAVPRPAPPAAEPAARARGRRRPAASRGRRSGSWSSRSWRACSS